MLKQKIIIIKQRKSILNKRNARNALAKKRNEKNALFSDDQLETSNLVAQSGDYNPVMNSEDIYGNKNTIFLIL